MLRICHVSDLHFHGNSTKNDDAVRLLRNVRAFFDSKPNDKNYLLVTGDVSDDAEEDQFEQAARALESFKGQLLVVPGNHDAAWQGNVYSRYRERRFEDHFLKELGIEHSFLDKDAAVDELTDGHGTQVLAIGLNSNRQTTSSGDFATGEVGQKQLDALDRCLQNPQYEGYWRLVYLHHRTVKVKPLHPGMFLKDDKELMAKVHGRADVLAFGHQGGLKTDVEHEDHDEDMELDQDERPYRLNANSSVKRCKGIMIEFNGRPSDGPNGLVVRTHPFRG